MGETAAILFDTDRGEIHRLSDADLPNLFSRAHDHDGIKADTSIINTKANADADSEASDSLDANPWVQSLKQRVFTKIRDSGWGEGIDFLLQRLDGRDFEEVQEILLDFEQEFAARGLDEAAAHISSILSDNPAEDPEAELDMEQRKPKQRIHAALGASLS